VKKESKLEALIKMQEERRAAHYPREAVS
jgi:hypothetical protein